MLTAPVRSPVLDPSGDLKVGLRLKTCDARTGGREHASESCRGSCLRIAVMKRVFGLNVSDDVSNSRAEGVVSHHEEVNVVIVVCSNSVSGSEFDQFLVWNPEAFGERVFISAASDEASFVGAPDSGSMYLDVVRVDVIEQDVVSSCLEPVPV